MKLLLIQNVVIILKLFNNNVSIYFEALSITATQLVLDRS